MRRPGTPTSSTVGSAPAPRACDDEAASAHPGQRAAEARLWNLIASLDAVVWEAAPRPFRITYVAQRADEIFGRSLSPWRDDPHWFDREVVHAEDRDRVVAGRRAALDDGADSDDEFRAVAADGAVHWVREIVRATRDAAGSVCAVSGIIVDVTARKLAEQRLLVQHAVTSALAAAAAPAETVPRILEAICTHADWSWGALWVVEGDVLRPVASWHVPSADLAAFEAASRERTFARGIGLPGRVWASAAPAWIPDVVADDDFPRAAFAARSELHGAFGFPLLCAGAVVGVVEFFSATIRGPDASLMEMLATLGGPIGQFLEHGRADAARRNALVAAQAARAEAEIASRAKDEFLATVSHELRAPLTPMLLWSRMLRGGALDAATTARALGVIETNAKAQAQLIDDLLDVSNIVTGKLRLDVTPIPLGPSIEAAIASVQAAAAAKGVRIVADVGDPAVVSGDAARLQQVVWNLLSNAVRFTPRDGRVDVRLTRHHDEVELAVSDTGKGIPSEFVPHVFERFRQADAASTRAYGGLGLGLAIVRHLVELHGGAVRVESAGEDRGATFVVRLPLHRDGPAAGAELAERRVLLVDDDADTRLALATILERSGAEVRAVDSAAAALAVLDVWVPDVLVSDVGLPGEDGYTLMRSIRARAATAGGDLPAVALTGYAGEEDRVRGLAAGFDGHLVKPIDPVDLVAAVATLVAAPRPQRPVAAPSAGPAVDAGAAKQAPSADAVRDALAFVSHELRQPLAALRIWLNLLEAEAGDGLSAEARDHLEQIRASVNWMSELITGGLGDSRL